MTTLILAEGDGTWTIPASSNDTTTVYGSSAQETVIVEAGAAVSFNAFDTGDTLQISGNSSEYSIHSAGATVYLTHSTGSVISLAATLAATHIQFDNGNADLLIEPGAGIKLDDQLITGTAQSIDLGTGNSELSADQGTSVSPVTLDTSSGNFTISDDASAPGSIIVTGFDSGDRIDVSNASDGDYSFSNAGADVMITYNNNGTLNSITLTGAVSDANALVYDEATFEAAIGFDAFYLL